MGKTKRDLLKRKLAQAYNNAERSLANVQHLHDEFDPSHPAYADLLVCIGQMLTEAQKTMMTFWVHAWGEPPADILEWIR